LTIPWLEALKALIRALDGTAVIELEVVRGEDRVLVRRVAGAAVVRPAGTPAAGAGVEAGEGGWLLRTPLAGVFYAAPTPADPPYINPGDLVEAGQVVGLVEAMKVFNEIHAEQPGRLVRLLASNGQSVQAGDPLMEFAAPVP
jgi:acetyl-CoA carboxylase biotin carboxyl carrier protein